MCITIRIHYPYMYNFSSVTPRVSGTGGSEQALQGVEADPLRGRISRALRGQMVACTHTLVLITSERPTYLLTYLLTYLPA